MTLTEIVRARRAMFERKAGRGFADPEWTQLERQIVGRVEARIADIQDFAARPINVAQVQFRLDVSPFVREENGAFPPSSRKVLA